MRIWNLAVILMIAVLAVSLHPFAAASAESGELARFAADFTAHADAMEESFEISCSDELRELLFSNCSVPDQTYITQIKLNAGMISFSYYINPGSLKFVDCRYYEGKRIAHAWKTGRTDALTFREQQTLKAAQQLTDGIRGSELEREKAVHDILCRDVTYYTDPSDDHLECDCAIGAILNGRADCDGYSDAFYLLGSLAGLEVRYQHGASVPDSENLAGSKRNTEAGGHMWNLVRISGKWMMLDVTWDDQGDHIYYVFFNTGSAAEAKKHKWEPRTMVIPVEAASSNDVRPQGLEYADVWDRNTLYNVLRGRIGKQGRICLRYPDSFDLHKNHELLSSTIYSLGVTDYSWHFGADCAEIAYLSILPNYRICDTEGAALSYMEECASAGTRDFAIFFPPNLASSLFANDHAGVRKLLNQSRLKEIRYQYSDESGKVTVSNAEWYTSVWKVSGKDDLFSLLDTQLRYQAKEIICYLPAAIDYNALTTAINNKILSMGVKDLDWQHSDYRLVLTKITYHPEYRLVSSRGEIVSYLKECCSRRPQEIRVYCTNNLYSRLSGNDMFDIMKEAGLQQKNLSYSDGACAYIISPPEWR